VTSTLETKLENAEHKHHAMKAYNGREVKVLPIPNLGSGWTTS